MCKLADVIVFKVVFREKYVQSSLLLTLKVPKYFFPKSKVFLYPQLLRLKEFPREWCQANKGKREL